ncbi:hypothetical protein LguiB_027334 [Lonicera macranthoides]
MTQLLSIILPYPVFVLTLIEKLKKLLSSVELIFRLSGKDGELFDLSTSVPGNKLLMDKPHHNEVLASGRAENAIGPLGIAVKLKGRAPSRGVGPLENATHERTYVFHGDAETRAWPCAWRYRDGGTGVRMMMQRYGHGCAHGDEEIGAWRG